MTQENSLSRSLEPQRRDQLLFFFLDGSLGDAEQLASDSCSSRSALVTVPRLESLAPAKPELRPGSPAEEPSARALFAPLNEAGGSRRHGLALRLPTRLPSSSSNSAVPASTALSPLAPLAAAYSQASRTHNLSHCFLCTSHSETVPGYSFWSNFLACHHI